MSTGGPGSVLMLVVAIGAVAGIVALARRSPAAGLFGLIALGLCTFVMMRMRGGAVHDFRAAQENATPVAEYVAWGPIFLIGIIAVVALLIGIYSSLDAASRRTMHRGLLGAVGVMVAVFSLYFLSASSVQMRPAEPQPASRAPVHDRPFEAPFAIGPDGIKVGPADMKIGPDGIKVGPAEMKIGPDGISLETKTTEPAKGTFPATGTLTTFQNGQPANKTEGAPRPEWATSVSLNAVQRLVNGNIELVVGTDYFATPDETESQLSGQIRYEFNRFLDRELGAGAARTMRLPNYAEFVRVEQFDEVTERSVGTMHRSQVLLRISSQQKTQLAHVFAQARIERRTMTAVCAAALVLAGIGTLFGFLKLDTATRGFYTGRLKLATVGIFGLLLFTAELLRRGTLVDAIRDVMM